MNELISVIVLNYNGKEYLKNCFDSLNKQIYSPLELIMVDNNSEDGSVEYVRKIFPNIKIIINKTNFGFAEGNNIGVLNAKSKYIALLNNDTVVDKDWLKELFRTMQTTGSAIVGSKIYTEGVNPEYYLRNGTLNLLGYNIYSIFENLSNVFVVSGCSLLMDKEKIGLPFDKDYFFYSEDVYLSWLTRLRGYRILEAPLSVVHHLGSVSAIKQKSSFRTFYQERNRLLNLFLFYETFTFLKIIPFILIDVFIRPFLIVFNPNKSLMGWIKSIIWFPKHFSTVLNKRQKIQFQRAISDGGILKYMSCRLTNGQSIFDKIINKLSCIYCYLVKLRTVELISDSEFKENEEVLLPRMKYDHVIGKAHFERQTTYGQIIDLITEGSTVFDIGCSTGFLGKYLIEKKNCVVYGLEIDEKSAERAKSLYKKVFIDDIEKENVLDKIHERFDYIILGDVIEHLRDPDIVLSNIKGILKPYGSVLMSIPNIATWKIRLNLLFGKFEYAENGGILDKNHLRFFTLKSMSKMVSNCGFRINYFRGAGSNMPIFLRNSFPSLLASQFVFELKINEK
ncbi:MAG: glycosyltransferase [Elusimicrobia bacterium]|nr:glycosyltransferase [Elusimicrobiota bacterium]